MARLADKAEGVLAMARQLEILDPPISMLILERGLYIRWVSRAAIEEFGIKPERLIGRSWYDIFPESRARRAQHDELFDGTRASYDLSRVPLRLKCDSPRYFSIRLRPIRAADGSIDAILGTGEDVTAQVQTEATLRESESRLEVALWSSKTAYWTIQVAGDHAEMSPQFFALTGVSEAEWRSQRHPWNSRMHADDLPRTRRIYDEFVAGRVSLYECEYRLRHPGGWLWLHDRGRIVERDADGRALIIAGTSQEASVRKSLELALAGAAEREQRRLSQDLHDGLGQELAGVQYLLASVTKRLRDRRDPEADELEQVLVLIRAAMASTRSMAHGLAAASLQSGGLKPALEDLAKEVSRSYGIHVVCLGDPGNPRDISDDAARNLYRIAQEALNNARRHGGATEVVITMHRSGSLFELCIEDNGCGVPLPLPEGPGIGLKIMAYRAQAIGASFTLKPRQEGGTQLRVGCTLSDSAIGDELSA
jgi:PAS domain S-box-containing protein